MKRKYLERLLQLAHDLIYNIPDHKFNMGAWGTGTVNEQGNVHVCGTAACALGWTAGLHKGPLYLEFKYEDQWQDDVIANVKFRGLPLLDENAGAKYFGIDHNAAMFLFLLHQIDDDYEYSWISDPNHLDLDSTDRWEVADRVMCLILTDGDAMEATTLSKKHKDNGYHSNKSYLKKSLTRLKTKYRKRFQNPIKFKNVDVKKLPDFKFCG